MFIISHRWYLKIEDVFNLTIIEKYLKLTAAKTLMQKLIAATIILPVPLLVLVA